MNRSENEGVTTARVAKEWGISAQQIYNWRRQFNRLFDKQFNSVGGVGWYLNVYENGASIHDSLQDTEQEAKKRGKRELGVEFNAWC